LSLWTILSITTSGCIEHEVLSPIPAINSIRFQESGNDAKMFIEFTDGDGNFGLEQSDTSGIFDECINAFNLFAEYYELQNGAWVNIKIDPCDDPDPDPDVPFYYKIPWAKPTGQDQTQQGIIEIALSSWRIESNFDTIKFVVHIVDRDIQKSNSVEVGPIFR
ncbi:MAG: hypothetical protein ACKOW8_15645, partial [Flavobacteriales bacterium]